MIEKLAARDDLGVEWSIDPDSGEWRYLSKDGVFIKATPPSWGLASATPKDLGSGNVDFNKGIDFYEVDSTTQRGLTNSTRTLRENPELGKKYRKIIFPAVAVAIIILAFVFVF